MVRKLKVTNFTNSENSDDFLEMAYDAKTKAKAKTYAKKALELDPDNLDAELFLADIGTKSQLEFLEKTEAIIAHGNKLMEEQGFLTKVRYLYNMVHLDLLHLLVPSLYLILHNPLFLGHHLIIYSL